MRFVLIALTLAAALWEPVRPGVWLRESRMATSGPLAAVKAVAVRIDPRVARFSLDQVMGDDGERRAWSIDSIPDAAMIAVNAGQFHATGPWGWVVRDGVELQAPGTGSVAMAFVVDSAGVPALVTPAELAARRGHVRHAFQSYPALLVGDGRLPRELEAPGRGVDLEHRDSRLAIGIRDDGAIIIALTRFTGLGDGPGGTLPWGPTVGEMATYMRSLGCRRAMLLDGGVSGQIAIRNGDGTLRRWPNWRQVPLGLVVTPPGDHSSGSTPSSSTRAP
jgi:exopolysaccharide biosynthesis protein